MRSVLPVKEAYAMQSHHSAMQSDQLQKITTVYLQRDPATAQTFAYRFGPVGHTQLCINR